MKDLSELERIKAASEELLDLLEKYDVMIGVDTKHYETPMVFLFCADESDWHVIH